MFVFSQINHREHFRDMYSEITPLFPRNNANIVKKNSPKIKRSTNFPFRHFRQLQLLLSNSNATIATPHRTRRTGFAASSCKTAPFIDQQQNKKLTVKLPKIPLTLPQKNEFEKMRKIEKIVPPLEKSQFLNKSLEPTRWNVRAQKVKDPSRNATRK